MSSVNRQMKPLSQADHEPLPQQSVSGGSLTLSLACRSSSTSLCSSSARSSASSACCCRVWIFLFTASMEVIEAIIPTEFPSLLLVSGQQRYRYIQRSCLYQTPVISVSSSKVFIQKSSFRLEKFSENRRQTLCSHQGRNEHPSGCSKSSCSPEQ